MAFQEISTGYKPEFTLGGLYHGYNAANAEDMDKQELIKQFLANQHAQVQNPLDEQTAAQNLIINRHKADPRYGEAQIGIQEGQRDLQTASGSSAQALLPFKIAKERAEAQSATTEQNLLQKYFGGIQNQYDQSLPETQREASAQEAAILADTLSRGPSTLAKDRQIDANNDTRLQIAEMRRQADLEKTALQESHEAAMKYKEKLMRAYEVIADPNASAEQKAIAQSIKQSHIESNLAANPNAYKQTIDKKEFGLKLAPTAAEQQRNSNAPKPDPLGIR